MQTYSGTPGRVNKVKGEKLPSASIIAMATRGKLKYTPQRKKTK